MFSVIVFPITHAYSVFHPRQKCKYKTCHLDNRMLFRLIFGNETYNNISHTIFRQSNTNLIRKHATTRSLFTI